MVRSAFPSHARRAAAALVLALAAALPTASLLAQAPAPALSTCIPGERVEVVDYGKWHPAVVVGVRTSDTYSPCRVHWIGYETTLDAWVPLSYLRAAGAGKAEPIPGGPKAVDATLDSIARHGAPASAAASVASGHYRCVSFVRDHLVNSGDFTITGASSYTSTGGAGRYTYDPKSGTLTFHGSSWDGQSADYESRPRPRIHIHGPSGRRGLDCDGPEH